MPATHTVAGFQRCRGDAKQRDKALARSSETGELVSGFNACQSYFPGGQPPRVAKLQAHRPRDLCYDAFALLHSARTKTPIFVVERLTAAQLRDARDEQRTNRFFADARLPTAERAQLADYSDSGYDRGHMAPAGDMPTPAAMAQSFSLANMVPQAPQNNRGAWSKLESDTRKYVMRAKGPVFVFTTGVPGNPPNNRHGQSGRAVAPVQAGLRPPGRPRVGALDRQQR